MEIIKYSKRVFSSKHLQKLGKYGKNNPELYIRIPRQNDSRNSACYLAACHKTPCRAYIGSIVFIVEGMILRLNKNPNTCSGRSKQPSYAYRMVKRRRQFTKEGYGFHLKTKEWVQR